MNLKLYYIEWHPNHHRQEYGRPKYVFKAIAEDFWKALDMLNEKEGFHIVDQHSINAKYYEDISIPDAIEWMNTRWYDLCQSQMDLKYELIHKEVADESEG